MFRFANALLSASMLTLVLARSAPADIPLYVNEFMAANGSTIQDPQGEYDDWIELYNGADHPVDVGGMYLTDDLATPRKWQIPTGDPAATTIAAKGYLLVWADGQINDPGLHADFGLNTDGETVGLFDTDGVTLIDSIRYDEQILDTSYGRLPDGTNDWQFMGFPSPGLANDSAYQGLVDEVTFSHERGFYDHPFEVSLACETPGATIYYTLDGSEPHAVSRGSFSGNVYDGPVLIYRSTCLRARAVKSDWMSSPTVTHTYVFLDGVIAQPSNPAGFPATWKSYPADYRMDPSIVDDPRYAGQMKDALLSIPSMSLVMRTGDLFDADQGIYANPSNEGVAWERPCSIELVYPDGREGFQINCGVRIQGGWFRPLNNAAKNSFRLLFKAVYGASKLRYPLFGDGAADEFDTITLRGGANDGYTWSGNERNAQFTRDQFARDLHRDTGHAAPRGMFVHLYVNGLYWGLYNPVERPDGSFSASYYGGQKEDWDVFTHKGYTLQQGDRSALNEMLSLCQEAANSYEAFQRLQGRDLDGSVNPQYPHLLDAPEYIDYMIVNMWAGNWDWPWNNYWVARNRAPDSTGFKFYCWDVEDIMLSSRSPLSMNTITNPDSSDVGLPHVRLSQNPEYRLMFADHLHRLFFNGGVLTPASLIQRYADLASTVEKAIIPETARWGDQHGSRPTQDDWYAMRDRILDTYLPQRSDIVLQQFRSAGLYPNAHAPIFYVQGNHKHGGHVLPAAPLTMQDTSGTIWYTLDGRDPRVPVGAAPTGSTGNPVLAAEDAPKRVLIPTGPVDDAWQGGADFDDSAWTPGTGGVGYERSTGYEQFFDIDVQTQMYGRNASCYIRIPFEIAAEDVEASSLLLKVRYDDGFIAYLNGTEVARRNFDGQPEWNSSASAQNSDIDAIDLEAFDISQYANRLRQGGNILAIHGLNESNASSDFLISATLVTGQDNAGANGNVSPSAIRYTGPISLTQSTRVKARAISGSTWSALNEATFAVGPVAESLRISEIMYH
ncbi:MAG: CotH kinase family protein, partial [Sedimentisphaerales bacterium]|nr:CotH kinase family protein [Sedimentisphaerales bacterium]